MKNKTLLITIIVTALLGLTVFFVYNTNTNLRNLATDSGFDSDWGGSDFGGSDWGDSSFDWGNSSYDWDDSDYDSVHRSARGFTINISWILFILIFIIIPLIDALIKESRKNNAMKLEENEDALKEIEQEIPDFDKEKFYNFVYEHFIKVQNAWTDFNYDELRKLVTDELYNMYKTQLTTLELKKQKNIMNGFELDQVVIKDFKKSSKEYTFDLQMRVRFYDYLATVKGNLLKGSNKRRIIITYNLTYLRTIEEHDNKCPNCGSKLENVASNICPYCNSVIVSKSHDYVLAKKSTIDQRRE